jgi:hypothetical protein
MDPCKEKEYKTPAVAALSSTEAAQNAAKKVAMGALREGLSGLKMNKDGSIDVSSMSKALNNAFGRVGLNCLGVLVSKIRQIASHLSQELKDLFNDKPNIEIEKLGGIIKENLYGAIGSIAGSLIGSVIGSLKQKIADIKGFINDQINNAIGNLSKKFNIFVSITLGPIESAYKTLKTVNSQIEQQECDLKFLLAVASLIASIRRKAKDSANKLTAKDYGDLLDGKIESEDIRNFYEDLIADNLTSEREDLIRNNDRYKIVQKPTIGFEDLYLANTNLDDDLNSTNTKYLDLESLENMDLPDLLIDTYNEANLDGLWDTDFTEKSPATFKIYDSFVVSGKTFSVMSHEEVSSLFTLRFTNMFNMVDFTNELNKTISTPNSRVKSSNLGDIIFHIGIECDASFGEADGIYTAIMETQHIIYERTDNSIGCDERLDTMIKSSGYSKFYGIGSDPSTARLNAFTDAMNGTIKQIFATINE